MTPAAKEKIDQGHRYWTPRLVTGTFFFNLCMLGLWYFVVNWMTEIKSDVKDIQSGFKSAQIETSERRIAMAAWKQNTTDKIDNIDTRLVRVEGDIASIK